MPELPDVELFRRYLEATALHRRITSVVVYHPRVVRGMALKRLQARLSQRVLQATRRHGKVLFVRLDNATWLIFHFGMSGRLHYCPPGESAPPYTRLLLRFTQGDALAYVSQRMLGKVLLAPDAEQFLQAGRLGPDALDPALDERAFQRIFGRQKGMVKPALMNQHLVAGIGNIYADEILFQARVHPARRLAQVKTPVLTALFRAMRTVLRTAIACQADVARMPCNFLLPQRHEGGRCPRCGQPLQRLKITGRGTYLCPACQPEVRSEDKTYERALCGWK